MGSIPVSPVQLNSEAYEAYIRHKVEWNKAFMYAGGRPYTTDWNNIWREEWPSEAVQARAAHYADTGVWL